jgi:hypothetical protein
MIAGLFDDGDVQPGGAEGARHEEWLLDEAIRDSFPASDPASSSQPGSIVCERYAVTAREGANASGPLSRR